MDPLEENLAGMLSMMYSLISITHTARVWAHTHTHTYTLWPSSFSTKAPATNTLHFPYKDWQREVRATKAAKDGSATDQRVGQQPKGNGDLDLSNGHGWASLSNITQKSGSRCIIAISATGDAVCGPDPLASWPACHPLTQDALLLRKSQGRFLWAGRLRAGGIFSCFVFLNPASRLLCKHTVKPTHMLATSVHLSHHCTQTLLHKPTFPLTQDTQRHLTRAITTTTIIIALCRNGTFTYVTLFNVYPHVHTPRSDQIHTHRASTPTMLHVQMDAPTANARLGTQISAHMWTAATQSQRVPPECTRIKTRERSV